MATIRKRGTHWEAQVRRRDLATVSKTFLRRADAEAWASTIESEVARGVFIDRTIADITRFDQLLERYAAEITPQKKGCEAEQSQIVALRRDPIAQLSLSALDGPRLAKWRDARLTQVSGSTCNRNLNLISHIFSIARKEWGFPIGNPVADIRRPKQNRARRRRLSAAEEAQLLAAFEAVERDTQGRMTEGCRNTWMRPITVIALETAMRRSEILSLDWADLNLANGVARLNDTKNGDSRDVPLSSRAIRELALLPHHESGKVFPISAESVKKAFARGVRRAGLRNLHFHDLRHEATTRLAEKLGNVLELSSATGHRTLSMLQRYFHPYAADLAKKLG